ncbi:serine/threonine-protein kinase DCLK2 [Pimephales promelas]|nr:serine/threonine-protein kinase DCLK2 [Pimephales promelas]
MFSFKQAGVSKVVLVKCPSAELLEVMLVLCKNLCCMCSVSKTSLCPLLLLSPWHCYPLTSSKAMNTALDKETIQLSRRRKDTSPPPGKSPSSTHPGRRRSNRRRSSAQSVDSTSAALVEPLASTTPNTPSAPLSSPCSAPLPCFPECSAEANKGLQKEE